MKTRNRLLAAVLTLVMIVGMLPVSAFAERELPSSGTAPALKAPPARNTKSGIDFDINFNLNTTFTYPSWEEGYPNPTSKPIEIKNKSDEIIVVTRSEPTYFDIQFEGVLGTTVNSEVKLYPKDEVYNGHQIDRSFIHIAPIPNLSQGTYEETITFTAKTSSSTVSKKLTVSFTVLPAGSTAIDFEVQNAYAFPSMEVGYSQPGRKAISLDNTGTAAVRFSISGSYSNFDVDVDSNNCYPSSNRFLYCRPKTGLAAGKYTEQIAVVATHLSDSSKTVTKYLTVSFEVLSAESGTIDFEVQNAYTFPSAEVGYSQPDRKEIALQNTGTAAVKFSISGSYSTFDAEVNDSICQPSSNKFLYCRPKTGLAVGTYTEQIAVVATHASDSSKTVTKYLTVSFEVLSAGSTAIDFTLQNAHTFPPAKPGYSQPENKAIALKNTGTAAVRFSISGSYRYFDTRVNDSICQPSSNSFIYCRPKANLAAGTYTEQIAVVATDASNSNKSVTKTITLSFAVRPDLESITIKKSPNQTIYVEGDYFNSAGMEVIATYKGGFSEDVTQLVDYKKGALTTSDTAITISYTWDGTTKTASQKITVNAPQPTTYTVTVKADPTAGGTVTGGGKVTAGQSVTVKATAKSGYSFEGWYNGTAPVSTDNPYTFTPAGDITLTAKFKQALIAPTPIKLIVDSANARKIYHKGDSLDVQGLKLSVSYNTGMTTELRMDDAALAGLISGYDSGQLGKQTLTVTYTAYGVSLTGTYQVTVVEKNDPLGFTITLDANRGTVNGSNKITVKTNEYGRIVQDLPTPSPIHGAIEFMGWSTEKRFDRLAMQNVITTGENGTAFSEDTTVYALWNDQDMLYYASFYDGDDLLFVRAVYKRLNLLMDAGSDPTKDGHSFAGWYADKTLQTPLTFPWPLTEDIDIFAKFEPASTPSTQYTVSVQADPTEGGTVTGGGKVTAGQSVTVEATANPGYVFGYWYDGKNIVYDASYTFNVTEEVTLTAYFVKEVELTVAADPAGGGTVTGGGTYSAGSSATVTATANDGYVFTGWYEGNKLKSYDTSYVVGIFNENKTVTARFLNVQVNVVDVEDEPVDPALYTVKMECNKGPWFGYQNYSGAIVRVTIEHGDTLLITRLEGVYRSFGTNQTFTDIVDGAGNQENYQDVYSGRQYDFTMPDDPSTPVTITAKLENIGSSTVESYKVSVQAEPAAGGTVTGGGKVTPGESVTVTAAANSGYVFDGWYLGATLVSPAATYIYKPSGDVTLTAKFTPAPVSKPVLVTVTGNTASADYDGTEKSVSGFGFTAKDSDGGDVSGVTVTLKSAHADAASIAKTNAGDYYMGLKEEYFEITLPDGYTLGKLTVSDDGMLRIAPADISTATVIIEDQVYNSAGVWPDPTVTWNGIILLEGSDYDVVCDQDVNVGDKTATITGKGNYTGAIEKTFAVKPLDASNFMVIIEPNTKEYNGKPWTFVADIAHNENEISVAVAKYFSSTPLESPRDFTLSWSENSTDVGTVTVTATMKGNYTGSATGTFRIEPAKVTITGLSAQNKTYDGNNTATVTGEAKINGAIDGDKVSVKPGSAVFEDEFAGTGKTVTFSDYELGGEDAGSYTLDEQPAPVTANILPADQEPTITATAMLTTGGYELNLKDLVSGAQDEPTFSIKSGGEYATLSGTTLTSGNTTGTVVINVRIPKVNLGGDSTPEYKEYAKESAITVTVTDKKVLTLSVNDITVTYTGNPVANDAIKGMAMFGTNVGVLGSWEFKEDQSLTNVVDSGPKTVIFKPGTQDYAEAETTLMLTINKADPTVSGVTVTAPATVYANTAIADIELSCTSDPSGGSIKLDNGQTLTLGTKDYNWTYTPKDTDNYNTVTGKVSITVEATTTGIKLNSDNAKKTYTEGDTLDVNGLTLTVSKSDGSKVMVDVTASMVTGFDGSKTGKQTLTVTYEGFTATYDIEVKAKSNPPTPTTISYAAKDGSGNTIQSVTWQKESRKNLDITFKRSEDDHLTYGLFGSLEIGGVTVDSANYGAAEGSLKLSIKPEYLETLSVGDHTVKVNFQDGSATVKLTVKAAAVNPTTGDESNLALWSSLMFLSVAAMFVLLLYARKKNEE